MYELRSNIYSDQDTSFTFYVLDTMATNAHTTADKAISKSFGSISPEEIQEGKEVFETDGVKGYEAYLQNKIDAWKTIPLNIGIVGNAGSGKSSFINAVRDLNGDDEGAAKVGVTETTKEPRAYSHPNNELMKFWDLPGAGTPSFPKESYLERIGFDKFDFFLIVTHKRFTETDAQLAQEITNKGKQFFFVRTHIQQDIDNDKKAHPKKHKKEQELVNEILRDLKENLRALYKEDKVFLIDNYERNKFEFFYLAQSLIEDFPDLKRQAFIFSINAFSKQMVKAKVKELHSTIRKYSALSGVVAAVPVPGLSFAVDLTFILKASKFFFNQLGLDESSLERMASLTNTDPSTLKTIVKKNFDVSLLLTSQGIKEFLVTIPAVLFSDAAEEYLRLIPGIGPFIAAPISAGTTYYILKRILKKMEEVALLVLETTTQEVSIDVADEEQN
ncbi:unnamed protein product [Adineta ricciae]|uniref:IRG-type G domain-containing protein n=1 Tax=Adineta ricciae TaxID=249248 RepID=A0A815TDI7_ADIRI|nr:unnamed protein product [Adineta ricciae]